MLLIIELSQSCSQAHKAITCAQERVVQMLAQDSGRSQVKTNDLFQSLSLSLSLSVGKTLHCVHTGKQ